MPPVVSICMPHLNSRPFTEERMETILRQTFTDWELIIVDSHSDDGSLEILEKYAARDRRIRIVQAPRDGIYPNWNRGLKLCAGQYVYIATSDDTMTADCLEQMADALARHPDCGVCHCCLEIIDEHGAPIPAANAWDQFTQQRYFGEWIQREHIRRAPHDGLLHFGLFTVYTSLTQLLVRRSVYEKLGLFRTDSRTYADFEWGMRVGLRENVVHLPRKLATWRRHGQQATQPTQMLRARQQGEFRRLAREAVKSLAATNRELFVALKKSPLNDYYLVDEFAARRQAGGTVAQKAARLLGFVGKHPLFSLRWFLGKLIWRRRITKEFGEAVRTEFARLGLQNPLRRTDSVASQNLTP